MQNEGELWVQREHDGQEPAALVVHDVIWVDNSTHQGLLHRSEAFDPNL